MAGLSEKQKKLKDALYSIWDDRGFVLGIGSTLKGDDEVQIMLAFLESGEWERPSDLTVKALFIARDRKKRNPTSGKA